MGFRSATTRMRDLWNRRQGRRPTPRRDQRRQQLLASERLETRAMLSGDGFRSSVTADDVAVDSLGNTYMVGSFRGTVYFDPGVGVTSLTSVGRRDAYLVKFDSTGAAEWVRGIHATGSAAALAVAVDTSGTVVVGGAFRGTATVSDDPAATLTSGGEHDGFVTVFNDAGVYQWGEAFGGARDDTVHDVAVDAVTGVVAVGEVGLVAFGGDAEGFIAVRTLDGASTWNREVAASEEASVHAVAVTSTGDVVVGGVFEGDLQLATDGTATLLGRGGEDGFVATFDGSTGDVVWGDVVGGVGEDAVYAVAVEGSGRIAIGGQVEVVGDDLAGVSTSSDDGDGHDQHDGDGDRGHDDSEQGFVSMLTAAGIAVWSQTVAAESAVRAVAVSDAGNVTVGGAFEGQLALGSAATAQTYFARGREQGFVMQLDASGGALWAMPFDGGRTQVNAVTAGVGGNVFVASTGGVFRGGYLTELSPQGDVLRSDSFAATAASKWHRHRDDDGRDDQFEDDWDDDGPAKPLGLAASVKIDLPLRIEFDDREPLFLEEDDLEREKVRRSLEHRDGSADLSHYDFSSLTQGQIALLQAWSAYATNADGAGDDSHGDGGHADDDASGGHDDDHGIGDDNDHNDDGDQSEGDDDGGRHGNHHDGGGITLPISFDTSGFARLTGTVAGEHDSKRFSFVAPTNGVVTVDLRPDTLGLYPELEVKDAGTGRELLELEPHEHGGSTRGVFLVTAGHTYVLEVEAPEDWMTVNFMIDLQIS